MANLQDIIRFEYIVYPLWRRAVHPLIKRLSQPILSQIYPVQEDMFPPSDPMMMAQALVKWNIIPDEPLQAIAHALSDATVPLETLDLSAQPAMHDGSPVRIPAQWEAQERILIAWAVPYPPVWAMHAQMAEAISQVAICEILVPSELWGRAIWLYLQRRARAQFANLRLSVLKTNDIWIRDYGPIIGKSNAGERVALNATYAVLPQYPQSDDDGMAQHWAAHHGIKLQALDLHTEGGNLWSDGQGTLIMSEQIFYSNRYHSRASLERYLHQRLQFDKLIITPRLTWEETGHVDLLMKLADAQTVLFSTPTSLTTAEALRKARRVMERTCNAQGQAYHIIDLPTPALKLNWFSYTLRRHYTNALTVNGRVLVPTYRLPEDDLALRAYEQAMPKFEIVPIDSALGANGGGAVHCMTKEIPV